MGVSWSYNNGEVEHPSETQQFYQKQNYEETVPSPESFSLTPQSRRIPLFSSNSSYNNGEVELPNSVQKMLNRICEKERKDPPDDKARRLLLALGEERSLWILNKIYKCQIKKTLSGFIVFMAKEYYPSETQQFYQKQNYEGTVPSPESFNLSPQSRRISPFSPNSSCSSVNFSPRNRPLFQENGKFCYFFPHKSLFAFFSFQSNYYDY